MITIHTFCDLSGVLTKPDRCQDAAHEKWARYISDEIEALDHGWFCIKQHDTQSGHAQPNLQQARDQEAQYFDNTAVWRRLSQQAQSRLGTEKLVRRLEEILSELISKRYGIICISSESVAINLHRILDIGRQISDQAESTAHQLRRLGNPPSDDSIGEIDTIVDQLVGDIERGIGRVSREEGDLLYLIEDEAMRLKNELRATCPEFRAWEKDLDLEDLSSVKPLPEILLEEGERPTPERTRKVIYLDEVLNRKTRHAVTAPCVIAH